MNQQTESLPFLTNEHQQVLRKVRYILQEYGYTAIKHKRISYENDKNNTSTLNKATLFQGLTHAQYTIDTQNTHVIIKWFYYDDANSTKSLMSNHELLINKQLVQQITDLRRTQKNIEECIVLPIITHTRKVHEQIEFLTLPFYHLGDVKQCLHHMQKKLNKDDLLALKMSMVEAIFLAVNEFHKLGWIHGDIKSTNIVVDRCEWKRVGKEIRWEVKVKLVDFAISTPQTIETECNPNNKDNNKKALQVLTQGTPAYLAPECWQGEASSIYSDYYAVGITIIEVLLDKKLSEVVKEVTGGNLENLEAWRELHCMTGVLSVIEKYDFDSSFSLLEYNKYLLNDLLDKNSAERKLAFRLLT